MTLNLRNNISQFVTEDYWKSHYSGFISYPKLQYNILNEWAGNIEWSIASQYFNINIIIYRGNTKSIYWGHDNIDKNKRIVFIMNKNDIHFNPLIFVNNNKNHYTFKYSKLISEILQ